MNPLLQTPLCQEGVSDAEAYFRNCFCTASPTAPLSVLAVPQNLVEVCAWIFYVFICFYFASFGVLSRNSQVKRSASNHQKGFSPQARGHTAFLVSPSFKLH